MNRKDFISNIATLAAGAACTTFIASCTKSDDNTSGNNNPPAKIDFTIDLTDTDSAPLQNVGGFITVLQGSLPIIIINAPSRGYIAMSQLCTHASCLVTYNNSNNDLPCPCHGSKFNIDGQVLNGPATKPLKKFLTSQSGSILRIYES